MNKEKILLNEAIGRMTSAVRLINRIPRNYGLEMLLFPTEIHMIEAIENHPDSNTTDLAILFNITKGSVSKMLSKLYCKGLIERYQEPNNKKEVYFRLSPLGKKAFNGHNDYHEKNEDCFYAAFAGFNPEQKEFVTSFINLYTDHLNTLIEDEEMN